MNNEKEENFAFETEVRRIASELFPTARVNGPVILEDRERDGVYNDGEVIHIVEATVSKRREKVRGDLQKSTDLLKQLRRQYLESNFKIWVVTKTDPTAEQQACAPEFRKSAKAPVEICSYAVFAAKLFDGGRYLALRENYPFGSVRNPNDDHDIKVPYDEYVPLDLVDLNSRQTISVEKLQDEIARKAGTFVLLGDFGAGKSMTMRHIFQMLKVRFLRGDSTNVPVYLNLRDHFGQKNPAEALIRHAENVGLPLSSQLVGAWRAGHVHLLLDGFDELSSERLVRGTRGLRQARREAVRLIKAFADSHPRTTALFISGREHYFDDPENELRTALGISLGATLYTLNEFTQDQIEAYLMKKNIHESVPDWLPARPLLVGYLAVKGILSSSSDLVSLSRETGWDYLLDRISEREAGQIDSVSIEPAAVREFIERLATHCRQYSSGRGPITLDDIHVLFESVFAVPPDEQAERMIFRMPGFTGAAGQAEAREFIDDDYVDACRAGDLVRFITAPHDDRFAMLKAAAIQSGDLGCGIAALKLREATAKQLSAALEKAAEMHAGCLELDLIGVMQQLDLDYVGAPVNMRDSFFGSFEVTPNPNFLNVRIQECFFSELFIPETPNNGPIFENCEIEKLHGALTQHDLPKNLFKGTNVVSEFANDAGTNADILGLPLPLGIKVMMTILRKLFFQAGRGRKENAFFRGLDARARVYVPEILKLVEQVGFAKPQRINGPRVWIPNRAHSNEARDILQAPQQSTHVLARKVRELIG